MNSLDSALDRYIASLRDAGEMLSTTSYIDATPKSRAQAMSALMALAAYGHNSIIAPRQSRPRFFMHSMFEPNVFLSNAPNPDFSYCCAFVDGRQRYRITGNFRAFAWVVMQVAPDGPWGVPGGGVKVEDRRGVRTYDFDDFHTDLNGDFEIIASAENPGGGNWIELDPASDNNFISLRRTIYDWTGDTAGELHIEPIDSAAPPQLDLTEEELASRLVKAGETLKHHIKSFILGWPQRCATDNEFIAVDGPGNLGAHWGFARFAVEPGEALIVESEVPEYAKYWGVHLTDIFFSTLDYVAHQSKINAREAAVDGDGRFRAVIAMEDSGVTNWLDPQHNSTGTILFRWYRADSRPAPTITRVPLGSLFDALPVGTSRTTPEQRAQRIATHGRGVLRHYGY